jgi:hypothetical protein
MSLMTAHVFVPQLYISAARVIFGHFATQQYCAQIVSITQYGPLSLMQSDALKQFTCSLLDLKHSAPLSH